ncbi:hypothetical protein ACVIWU_006474 [Bradyrhizobium sp. USDA 4509]
MERGSLKLVSSNFFRLRRTRSYGGMQRFTSGQLPTPAIDSGFGCMSFVGLMKVGPVKSALGMQSQPKSVAANGSDRCAGSPLARTALRRDPTVSSPSLREPMTRTPAWSPSVPAPENSGDRSGQVACSISSEMRTKSGANSRDGFRWQHALAGACLQSWLQTCASASFLEGALVEITGDRESSSMRCSIALSATDHLEIGSQGLFKRGDPICGAMMK